MPRKTLPLICILLFLVPLLLAMGGGGSRPLSNSIPRPKVDFGASLVDRQGVETHVSQLACGGKTFFPLERGEGTLMIPFDKIERLRFGADAGGGLAVTVTTAGGQALEGALSGSLLLTGVTEFGNYRVPLGGVSEISFD